jgi:hypothetical protein
MGGNPKFRHNQSSPPHRTKDPRRTRRAIAGFLLVGSSAGSRFVGAAHAQAVPTTVELDGPDHLSRRHVKVRRPSCCGGEF